MEEFSRDIQSKFEIDFTKVAESGDVVEIKPGEYVVICESAEVKDTKSGNGKYINCRFRITLGEAKGQVVWHIFNIDNPSAQATQIGLSQLKKYMRVIGRPCEKLKNINDLLDGKCLVTVKIEHKPPYGASPRIIDFMSIDDVPKAQDNTESIPF